MKRLCPTCLFVFVGAAILHAGPREAAIMAVMRLSDHPNYTWVATVQDDARTYDITGRTTREGFTHVKMPAINSVRRRLGRSVTDTQVEFIFRGNVDCVLETDEGWKKPDELSEPAASESEQIFVPTGHAPAPGPSGSILRGVIVSRGGRVRAPERQERHYSNLQLAISHPHEELAVIVSSHTEFNVEADVVTGRLTDLGAQLLLVRDGQKQISPLGAAGTFKIWIRGGMVTRYQVNLEGVLSVDTPSNGRKNIAVQQITTTVIKDVGTTSVDVPEQARRKLME